MWALIAALGTADALVGEDSHDLAAHATAAARSSRSWFIVVCWYEAINNLVEQLLRRTLETGETINVPDLASEITETLLS